MKKLIAPALLALLVMMLVALVSGSVSIAIGAEVADDGKGQEAFLTQKCNSCHGVPSVGIESKTQSAAMKGPDLPTAAGNAADRDLLLKYVRKEAEFDGKKHKKGAKATDEELNVVLDWLAEQPVPETE
jgi:mono/diheme cytochrome c family protein